MITKADDYPVHQTPDPIAVSYNRNQYDRYFFNGFSGDGACSFAVAFGVTRGGVSRETRREGAVLRADGTPVRGADAAA